MAGLIYNLMDILDKEEEHYIELLAKAKEKTEVIVKNDIDKLQEITSIEQTLASKLTKLEKQREVVLEDICLVLNLKSKDFTISDLIEKLGNSEEEKKRLINIKDKIADKVNELKNINEKNKIIINQSLDFVNFTLNAVQSKKEVQSSSYKYGGALKESERGNSFFDTKQ